VPDENASRMSCNVKKFLRILKQINLVYIHMPGEAVGWSYKTPGLRENVVREISVSS
jgi:hypothetical protein